MASQPQAWSAADLVESFGLLHHPGDAHNNGSGFYNIDGPFRIVSEEDFQVL